MPTLTNIDTLSKNFSAEGGHLELEVIMAGGKKYVTDAEGSAMFPLRIDEGKGFAKGTKLVVDKATGKVISADEPVTKPKETVPSTKGCSFGTTIMK